LFYLFSFLLLFPVQFFPTRLTGSGDARQAEVPAPKKARKLPQETAPAHDADGTWREAHDAVVVDFRLAKFVVRERWLHANSLLQ
jgi:hypothetical protein